MKHKESTPQDKKLQAISKKAGAKKIGEVAEINIFKTDNTVVQFKKPQFEYSLKEKVSFVVGIAEEKRDFLNSAQTERRVARMIEGPARLCRPLS